jgi:hypothetical protein
MGKVSASGQIGHFMGSSSFGLSSCHSKSHLESKMGLESAIGKLRGGMQGHLSKASMDQVRKSCLHMAIVGKVHSREDADVRVKPKVSCLLHCNWL